MQSVSAAWKTNQKELITDEAFIEIAFRVIDNAAQTNASFESSGSKPYCDLASVVNGLPKIGLKYATCEGLWSLDGTCSILPDASPYGQIGYVGVTRCDANGRFALNPVCSIRFSQVVSTSVWGLTITFSTVFGEYAKTFKITSYNGNVVLDSKLFDQNSDIVCLAEFLAFGYDRIDLEIIEWSCPGHFARVDDLLIGIIKNYSKSNITKFAHSMSVDPISTGLPIDEVKFSIDNLDGRFNPLNQQGVSRYLIERQEMSIRYGYMINGLVEWVDGATVWLYEWDTPTNGIEASFTAKGLVTFMQGKYSGTLNDTLYNIAVSALTQADLPLLSDGSNRWDIDESLSNISVNITGDYDKTIAETLQYIANAARCVIYQDRQGILHITPFEPHLSDYNINLFNSYKFGGFELLQPLYGVTVNDGMYVSVKNDSGETESLNNPFIQTEEIAQAVGDWVSSWLCKRASISGEYRADPRLDCLDGVKSENKYALTPLLITSIAYTFNGAFNAKYVGRVYNEILTPAQIPLGTTRLGGEPTWVFPLS